MRLSSRAFSRVLEVILLTALGAGTFPAFAQETHEFNIPAEPAPAAIRDFGSQANVQILAAGDNVKDKQLHAVNGEYSTDQGLRILLTDSGLSPQYVGDRSIALVSTSESQGFNPAPSGVAPHDGDETPKEGKKSTSDGFRVAQVDQTPTGNATVEEANKKDQVAQIQPINTPEILVIGSRILNVDVKRTEDDVQPYYILDSQQIQQSGALTVEDFLKQQLTMNTTVQTASQSASSLGATSLINLRGLGFNETLILIDGRRSAAVSSFGSQTQPDLNGIPLSAIERIEVLPSSASAIYGGAAMGGVVNVILKKNYDGGELSYTFDNSTETHAPINTVSATYGTTLEDGKTQLMLTGSYSHAEVLVQRDLVQRGAETILKNSPSFFYSESNPFLGAATNIASADGSNLILKNGSQLNSPTTYVPAGISSANLPAALLANAGMYNLDLPPGTVQNGSQGPLGSAPTAKSFMGTIRREMTSFLDVFSEFSDVSNASLTYYNPIGSNGPYTVPSTAPTNPFQQDVLVMFPSSPTGPVTSDSVSQSVTLGLLARLPANWKSELDYTWSRNSFEWSEYNSDDTALGAALASGAINPFGDTVGLNLNPYLAPATFSGRSTLNDLALRASGPVGSFSWGQPNLTVGLEHRKEGFDDSDYYNIYPLTPESDFHRHYFGQSQSTDSIYMEALVPLVTAKNAVLAIRSIDLQLAGRSEKYTVSAGTPYVYLAPDGSVESGSPPQGVHKTIDYTSTNPTVGLKYKPVDELAFRASYAEAFLPPTARQLLPNPTPAPYPITLTDPTTGQTYSTRELVGGNPNLQPQSARDWDFGLIFEPQDAFLRGLRVDVEYYQITQPNYITAPSPQQIVDTPAFASRVTRDPTTGRITLVDASYVNALQYKTSGWDLTVDYRKSTRFGTFNIHMLGTIIEDDRRQYSLGGPLLDYVGFPNSGGEVKRKANAMFSWAYRHWTLGWATTFYGSYWQHGAPGDPTSAQYGPNMYWTDAQGSYTIPSQIYHEIFGSYDVGKICGISNLKFQFAVKNVFNTLPPFDAFNSFSGYYSPYGDPRLRDYRLSVLATF